MFTTRSLGPQRILPGDAPAALHDVQASRAIEAAALAQHAPDIIVVDFSCADEQGDPVQWINCPFSPLHGTSTTGGAFFRQFHATTYAWLYVFRRELLSGNGLRFQPRINMQDAELLPRVMAVAKTVFVSGIDAYVYVKRNGSFINNPDPGVRARYFDSVMEVRRLTAVFLQELDEPDIREGVIAKLDSINRILLMAYVYDDIDKPERTRRLALLRREGVHPFATMMNEGGKQRMVRIGTNLQPLLFPRAYRWLRTRPAVRRAVAGAGNLKAGR